MSRLFCNGKITGKDLQRLRLEPGDAIVVSDTETMRQLDATKLGLKFSVPIVYAPNGVKRLSLKYLQKLVTAMEYAQAEG